MVLQSKCIKISVFNAKLVNILVSEWKNIKNLVVKMENFGFSCQNGFIWFDFWCFFVVGFVLLVQRSIEEGVPAVQHPLAAGFPGRHTPVLAADQRTQQRQRRRHLSAHSGSSFWLLRAKFGLFQGLDCPKLADFGVLRSKIWHHFGCWVQNLGFFKVSIVQN